MLGRLGLGYLTGSPMFMIRRRGHRCRRLLYVGCCVPTGLRCALKGNLERQHLGLTVVNDAGGMGH